MRYPRHRGQLHHLERSIGCFKGKLPIGVRFSYGNGILRCKIGGFCIEQPKGDTLQGSLLGPGLVAGDLAPEQLVVERYGCRLVSGNSNCLARGDLVAGGEIALLFCHGVLAGGQVLDVDFSCAVGGKGFRIPVALHQEGEALQHAVLGGLADQQASLGIDCDSLSCVVDVGVGGNLHPVLIQRFKHHNGGTSQGAGIQSISQFYGSNGFFRSELHLCSNFRAVYQEGLSCAFVHEDAGKRRRSFQESSRCTPPRPQW